MKKTQKMDTTKRPGTQGLLWGLFVKINLFIALLLLILIPIQVQAQVLTAYFQANKQYDLSDYTEQVNIIVTFKLKNNTKTDLKVLRWDTPFDTFCCGNLILKKNGKRLLYDGAFVKSGDNEKDYVLIPAGKTFAKKVKLSNFYFTDPGKYELSYDGVLLDIVKANEPQIGKRKNFNSVKIETKPVFFEITDVNKVMKTKKLTTLGMVARKSSKTQNQTLKDFPEPIILGNATEKEKQDTKEAHYTLIKYLKYRIDELNKYGKKTSYYAMLFGGDEQRYEYENSLCLQKVKKTINVIYSKLKKEQIIYYFTKDLNENKFAYTYKKTTRVYLCNQFRKASIVGTDSKTGTLMHELTHALASLNDEKVYVFEEEARKGENTGFQTAYGVENCKRLATRPAPIQTALNSDSYQYFIEFTTNTLKNNDPRKNYKNALKQLTL